MEVGGWLGLAEPRPIDALSLAFFSDALIPAAVHAHWPSSRPAPTIDLTVHFRTRAAAPGAPRPDELVLRALRARLIHEGFFEEDGRSGRPTARCSRSRASSRS